jgi:hypothetical protein
LGQGNLERLSLGRQAGTGSEQARWVSDERSTGQTSGCGLQETSTMNKMVHDLSPE